MCLFFGSLICFVLCVFLFFVFVFFFLVVFLEVTCSLILHCVHNYPVYSNVAWSLSHRHTSTHRHTELLSRLPSLWHTAWKRKLVMLSQQGFPSEIYEKEGLLWGDAREKMETVVADTPPLPSKTLPLCLFIYIFICVSLYYIKGCIYSNQLGKIWGLRSW